MVKKPVEPKNHIHYSMELISLPFPIFLQTNLTGWDIALGIILILGFISGFRKGLIREIASLVALVAGVYVALHFSYFLVDFLRDMITLSDKYINLLALLLTFVMMVILVLMAGKLITKLVHGASLGWFNRILGGIFGFLKTAFILSVLLMFIIPFFEDTNGEKSENIQNSVLFEPIEKMGENILPSIAKKIKNTVDWDKIPDF